MLRKPLHQPKGRNGMALGCVGAPSNGGGRRREILVAVGRLYINADNEGVYPFCNVHPSVQDKGLGTLMAMTTGLSPAGKALSASPAARAKMRLSSLPNSDFVNQGDYPPTTTPIRHFLMIKPVASLDDIPHRDWCGQLQLGHSMSAFHW